MKHASTWLLAGALLFASGCCNGDVGYICSLTVHFSRAVGLPYEAEIRTPDGSLLTRVNCVQGGFCTSNSVSFVSVERDTVIVRLTESSGVRTATLTPRYHADERQCSTCRMGDVTMQLPGQ